MKVFLIKVLPWNNSIKAYMFMIGQILAFKTKCIELFTQKVNNKIK